MNTEILTASMIKMLHNNPNIYATLIFSETFPDVITDDEIKSISADLIKLFPNSSFDIYNILGKGCIVRYQCVCEDIRKFINAKKEANKDQILELKNKLTLVNAAEDNLISAFVKAREVLVLEIKEIELKLSQLSADPHY